MKTMLSPRHVLILAAASLFLVPPALAQEQTLAEEDAAATEPEPYEVTLIELPEIEQQEQSTAKAASGSATRPAGEEGEPPPPEAYEVTLIDLSELEAKPSEQEASVSPPATKPVSEEGEPPPPEAYEVTLIELPELTKSDTEKGSADQKSPPGSEKQRE